MFFIIWGEKSRHEPHGVVGDFCPTCERVRPFTVSDYFTAPHVYYITMGGWSFQGRVRTCWKCGDAFRARLKDYDGFVEEERAERLTLREIVRRTNHPLAEWMDRRDNPDEGDQVRDRRLNGRRNTDDESD